jgi:hypothetical protein
MFIEKNRMQRTRILKQIQRDGNKGTKTEKTNINYVDLHVFWMVTNAVNKLSWLELSCADFVNCGKKWEFIFHIFCFKHVIDFLSGNGTLKKFIHSLNLVSI